MKPRFYVLRLLLFLATLAVFSGALECGFANLDDPEYVTNNAVVQAGFSWAGLRDVLRTPVLGNWHPLTMLSYQVDWQLFGPNPAAFHCSSLLWHAANAALVLAVFRALGISTLTALFAAALFAWHPLRVESVVWISERKDVLSGFFFLATLWCYLRFLLPAPPGRNRWAWYGAAIAAFSLGLLSKPMLVTTPAVLLLLDFLVVWSRRSPASAPHRPTVGACLHAIPAKNRVAARPHNGIQDDPHHGTTLRPITQPQLPWPTVIGGALVAKIPFVLLSLGVALITLATQKAAGATAGVTGGLGPRLATALAALPAYLAKTFWPTNLVPLYPSPAATPWTLTTIGAIGLVLSLGACAWQWKRRPWLTTGWLWFLGMLLPVCGLIQAGGQFIADRYTYLPGLGLLVVLAFTLDELRPQVPPRLKTVGIALGGLLLGLLALLTMQQTKRWEDPITLWEYTLERTTRNPIAHFSLGNAYIEKGRLAEAERELSKAIALLPGWQRARTNLGVVFAATGKPEAALEQFRIALSLGTQNYRTQLNIARILLSLGRYADAIAECQTVLTRWPQQPEAQALLNQAIEQQSRSSPPAGS